MSKSREMLEKYGKGRYDHMFELDRKYPEVEMFGDQCISAEVRPGWTQILDDLLKVLRDNRCKVAQIKQKFGGLRVYWNYPDEIEAARAEWRKQVSGMKLDDPNRPRIPMEDESDAIDVVVGPAIARAETLSFRTCEDCGADIGKPGGPGFRTQCDSCDKSP